MSDAEDSAVSGEIVTAPAADIRYEDEVAPDAVTRVLVVVERADGSVKEYEAREPVEWQMNDPESLSGIRMVATMGVQPIGQPGPAWVHQAVPSLRLSFTANPRYNLHIRNRRKNDQASISAASGTGTG